MREGASRAPGRTVVCPQLSFLRALLLSPPSTYDPTVFDRALTRTLPMWNTTGMVNLPGLRRAIEMMVEIGSLAGPLDAESLVDLRGLTVG